MLEAMINIWGERAVIALLEQSSWEESFRELFDQDLLSEKEVVPMFVSALGNKNEDVQLHALGILGFVTSGGKDTKEEVKEILRGMDGIVDLLLEKVQPGNKLILRKNATGLLTKLMLEPDRVVPVMISLLDEKDEELRIYAIISLGNYGENSAEAIPALEMMLNDPSEEIREEAEWALENIR
jgi:HEAT repeat protein